MEAVVYVAEKDETPPFTAVLWRFMQSYRDEKLSHKEMAQLLTDVGFKASENNVSQWLTGVRTPPPGLPYYSALALELEDDQARTLAWSFTRTYRDNRKGANRSGTKPASRGSGQSKDNVEKISEKREDFKNRSAMKRSEGQSDTGDRL